MLSGSSPSRTRKSPVRCSRRYLGHLEALQSRWSSTSTNTASRPKLRRKAPRNSPCRAKWSSAQRNLLLLLDLRTEGVAKVASQVRTALGGQSKQASTLIAGDMENFLASDVLYSQRVAPLIQQTLNANGIHESTATTSNFLPNLGWLMPETVLMRLTGKSSSATANGAIAPGTHGHSVTGVTVGASTLQPAPAVNHVHSGANPTFTVMVENGGSNPETNVKVEVLVTSGGKQLKASHVINKTEPGNTSPVDIPVEGVALNAASRVAVNVLPVPGETNLENNKQTYDVVFE